MKKRYLCITIIISLVMILMGGLSIARAGTIQKKKLIHVVIDDSGSMETAGRWEKAQYAMQILAGLLNPEDELEIYYLNSGKQKVDLSAKGIQKTMKTIAKQDHTPYMTSFKQVRQAYSDIQIKCKDRKNEYDQCWLVVLSDGAFNQDAFKDGDFSSDHRTEEKTTLLRSTFEQYTNSPLGNGKRLQIIYCRIGTLVLSNPNDSNAPLIIEKSNTDRDELARKGIFCYAAGEDMVIPVMKEIANQISGRSPIASENISRADDNSIQVNVNIPLFNFVVLIQGTDAELINVESKSNGNLTISRNAMVEPGTRWKKDRTSSDNIYIVTDDDGNIATIPSGGVYTIEGNNDNIPTGEYTLSFNKSISSNQVMILAEPALEIKLKHYKDGLEFSTEPGKTIFVGQNYGASAIIYEYGKYDDGFDTSKLPNGSLLTTEVDNGKDSNGEPRRIKVGESQIATIDEVVEDKVSVRGCLSMPGFNDILTYAEFIPMQGLPDTVTVTVDPNYEITGLVVTVESIKKHDPDCNVDFFFFNNNEALEGVKDYIDKGFVSVNTSIPYTLEYPQKGVVRFVPEYGSNIVLNQPYDVVLSDNQGRELRRAIITVTESTFSVIPDKTSISERFTSLRNSNSKILFDLIVDDHSVDAQKYQSRLNVTAIGKDQSRITPDWTIENGKIEVHVGNWNGITAQTYTVSVSLDQKILSDSVTLDIIPVNYEVQCISGDGMTIGALDLPKNNQSLVFRIIEKENGTERQLTYAELKENVRIQTDSPRIAADYNIDGNTGFIIVTPTNHDAPFLYYFTRAFDPQGKRTISVQYLPGNKWGQGDFSLQPKGLIDIIWPYLAAIAKLTILIIIVVALLKKPRFKKGSAIFHIQGIYEDDNVKNNEDNGNDWEDSPELKPSWRSRAMIFKPEQTKASSEGVFRACPAKEGTGVEILIRKGVEYSIKNHTMNTNNREVDIYISDIKTCQEDMWKKITPGKTLIIFTGGRKAELYAYKPKRN